MTILWAILTLANTYNAARCLALDMRMLFVIAFLTAIFCGFMFGVSL